MKKINITEDIFVEYYYEEITLIKAILHIKNNEVGSFYLYLKSDLENAILESFLIKKDYLKKGFGKILAQSVILISKKENIETIYLYAKPFNHKSINQNNLILFYEKYLNMNIIAENEELGYYMCVEL